MLSQLRSETATSRSQFEPGNTITAALIWREKRMLVEYGSSVCFDRIILDHRVCQQFLAHIFKFSAGAFRICFSQCEFYNFSLSDFFHSMKSKSGQSLLSGFSLGVKDARFESDVDRCLQWCATASCPGPAGHGGRLQGEYRAFAPLLGMLLLLDLGHGGSGLCPTSRLSLYPKGDSYQD